MGGCEEGAIGVDIRDLALTLKLQCEGWIRREGFEVNVGRFRSNKQSPYFS